MFHQIIVFSVISQRVRQAQIHHRGRGHFIVGVGDYVAHVGGCSLFQKEKKTTVDVIKKQKRREEKSVELGQKSRLITGKGIKEPILSVFVSNEDGTEKKRISMFRSENMCFLR